MSTGFFYAKIPNSKLTAARLKVEVRGTLVRKLTKVDTTPRMKNITKVKQSIRSEVRGKVMQARIRAVAESLAKDLEDDIADEVGNLTGKLTTDFMDDGSEIESELMSCAFDQISDALLGEIKKQLK